jgi:hypothetical protein
MSAWTTLSFFYVPCNLAEDPLPRNLGPLNGGDLGLLSSDSGFIKRQKNTAHLAHILRIGIIGAAQLVCQINQWDDGLLGVGLLVCEVVTRIDLLRGITVIAHKPERIR